MDQTAMFIGAAIVGFLAQMIDGSLGMGYGVISTTFLLVIGIPPALASSSVHVSKIFTNGASGLSHLKFGNVDKKLVKTLIIAGVAGGIAGAIFLSVVDGDAIKPLVAIYSMVMGILIIRKALFKMQPKSDKEPKFRLLGLAGGFFDAIGGGGWGPIVTSTLLVRGQQNPRLAIGTANFAEFFVAVAIVFTFAFSVSLTGTGILVIGLIVGGVIAAPVAAYLCGRLPVHVTMGAVGLLIIILSIRTILSTLG